MNNIKEENLKTEDMEVIEFEISSKSNKEKYAFDIRYVNEVFKIKKITQLPCTPSFIMGIINFRGKIISVIDIRNFVGFASDIKDGEAVEKVIIVKVSDLEVGIAIDSIIGYYNVLEDELQKNIPTLTDEKKDFIIGITKNGTIVLDIENIMLCKKIIINDIMV